VTTWPGTLPAFVLSSGYRESGGDQVIRSTMDGGATKSRRRFTRRFETIECTIILTPAQQATFETFFWTTLSGGALAFDWVLPRTQAAITFKFLGPPNVRDLNGLDMYYDLKLERQS
jgi:hypothetical protein